MLTTTVIKFPVLTIKDRVVDLVKSADELTSCTRAALKNGWYNGLLVIDAEGMGYLIEKAEFVRKKGKLFNSLFSPSLVEVSLTMKQGSPFEVSLEDLKSHLTKAIRVDPDFWSSAGADPKEIVRKVQQASSKEELLSVIRPLLTAGLNSSR